MPTWLQVMVKFVLDNTLWPAAILLILVAARLIFGKNILKWARNLIHRIQKWIWGEKESPVAGTVANEGAIVGQKRLTIKESTVGGSVFQVDTIVFPAAFQQPPPPRAPFKSDPFYPPERIFGRNREEARLRNWLKKGKPRVLQIFGQSGVGKTALAAKVICQLRLYYERLELEENETAAHAAVRLYEVMTEKVAPPQSHADIVAFGIGAWRERDCLLVIDNLHHLLDGSGHAKGDEAKLLLKRFGESGCRLLTLGWLKTHEVGTSRERVKIWELEGLGEEAGTQKLQAEGVKGSPSSMSLKGIVRRLDGNPKMLENLAGLIHDSGGDAAILDRRTDWVECSMAPMHAMWMAISEPLQELLAALCVLRRGRNAERLSRLFARDARDIQKNLDALAGRWKLARAIDGVRDYEPDHDLVRDMVNENYDEKRLRQLDSRAAKLWLEEGKEAWK